MKKLTLQPLITLTAAAFAAMTSNTTDGQDKAFGLEDVKEVLLTLKITTADRTNANETYDIYVTSFQKLASGAYSRWDIAHFPQIASTGAKTYTMMVKGQPLYPTTITTAGPGVAAVVSGSIKTDTAGSDQGIGTLTAGMVLHGLLGEGLAYRVVGGGTSPGPFTFEIQATVKG